MDDQPDTRNSPTVQAPKYKDEGRQQAYSDGYHQSASHQGSQLREVFVEFYWREAAPEDGDEDTAPARRNLLVAAALRGGAAALIAMARDLEAEAPILREQAKNGWSA